jgi:tetratricopeptide (TPR) repeat protein
MLKARKKITQREIKKDKLVTAYFQSREWLAREQNKKRIYTGIGIVVLAAIAVFFYINNKKAKNEAAESQLSPIISLYESGNYVAALNGDSLSNGIGFLSIIDNYGSTESGETAKFYAANCYFNLRDFDNALKYFEDYGGTNDMVKASCISGIGAVYEAKGDFKRAGEYFAKAANVNKELIINQENLFYAIRAYSEAGDKESANRFFQQLKEKYPKSKYISETKRFESQFKN